MSASQDVDIPKITGDAMTARPHFAARRATVLSVALALTMGLATQAPRQVAAATHEGLAAAPAIAPRSASPSLKLPMDGDLRRTPQTHPLRHTHGMLTAALGPGATSETSDAAARLQTTSPLSAHEADDRIGPGFAKPQRLGRLAAELPQPTVRLLDLPRYAALSKHHRHAARSRHVARAKHRVRHARHKAKPAVHTSGRIATNGHAMSCLPRDLRRVLNEVAANFGPIRINSTDRSHSHNRRVGGAPRSLHLECRAVDFAYHGNRRGALLKFLRNHDAVGGLGNYGHGGHIHIDDGPHRSW